MHTVILKTSNARGSADGNPGLAEERSRWVSTWCNELVVFLVSGKLHEGQCSEYMGTYNVPYYSKAGKSPQAAQAYHIKEIAIWKITLN